MVAKGIELKAEIRESIGKGAARRMRRHSEWIPAIIYGAGKVPQPISLLQKDILKALENKFIFSSVFMITVGNKSETVVLKDLQRHHVKPKVLHLDFQRIKATEKLTMSIPIRFVCKEKSPGVVKGGIVSYLQTEVEVRCLPANLPEYLEVDLSNLDLGESCHLSDLKLPPEVELSIVLDEHHNVPLASIHLPRASSNEAEETATSAEVATEAAPEAPADKKE